MVDVIIMVDIFLIFLGKLEIYCYDSLAKKYMLHELHCYFLAKFCWKIKDREERICCKVFIWRFLMAVWKGVYVYAASLVGRKEGRKWLWSWEGILAVICQSKMSIARLRHCWMCEWGMVAIGVAKVVFAGWGQERCHRPWMCGLGHLGREMWMSPKNVAQGWSGWMSERNIQKLSNQIKVAIQKLPNLIKNSNSVKKKQCQRAFLGTIRWID